MAAAIITDPDPEEENPPPMVQLPAVPAHLSAMEAWQSVGLWIGLHTYLFGQPRPDGPDPLGRAA